MRWERQLLLPLMPDHDQGVMSARVKFSDAGDAGPIRRHHALWGRRTKTSKGGKRGREGAVLRALWGFERDRSTSRVRATRTMALVAVICRPPGFRQAALRRDASGALLMRCRWRPLPGRPPLPTSSPAFVTASRSGTVSRPNLF